MGSWISRRTLVIPLALLAVATGCNFFEPFAKALNEDEEEVERFQADDALNNANYPDAYNRWRIIVGKKPNDFDARVKLGEATLGKLGINYFDILHTLDTTVTAGQTRSLTQVAPVNKDLVMMGGALDMIDDGSRPGDKGNAGFGYALLVAGKLLASFDKNGNRLIDTGEITDSTLWTSTTDYDKDGKSDFSEKTMGLQLEEDLLKSVTYLSTAIAVSPTYKDAKTTTNEKGQTVFLTAEYVDAYNAIRTTYTNVQSINSRVANQALSGQALASAIEALDN